MKVWHPWQLKKLISWGLFWSYQLKSTANLALLVHFCSKWVGLAVLAGSSQTAPSILIFSIAMSADYSLELNSIEIYAPQFFGHNN